MSAEPFHNMHDELREGECVSGTHQVFELLVRW